MSGWVKLRIISIFIGTILIPIAIAFIANEYSKTTKEKEIRLRFVELAIEILNVKQGNENANLRKWATEIISMYSEIPLSETVKKELIDDKIRFPEGVNRPNLQKVYDNSAHTTKLSLLDELLKKNFFPLFVKQII